MRYTGHAEMLPLDREFTSLGPVVRVYRGKIEDDEWKRAVEELRTERVELRRLAPCETINVNREIVESREVFVDPKTGLWSVDED